MNQVGQSGEERAGKQFPKRLVVADIALSTEECELELLPEDYDAEGLRTATYELVEEQGVVG